MERLRNQETGVMSVISLSEATIHDSRDSVRASSSTFTIGICVSDDAPNLVPLLDVLRNELFSPNLRLNRIVIVASGCSEKALSRAKAVAENDPRILLVQESARSGKAEAINTIIERCPSVPRFDRETAACDNRGPERWSRIGCTNV